MADIPPAEILSSATGDKWAALTATPGATDVEKEALRLFYGKAQRQLADVLTSENLIVLTGLGTSLCIKTATGETAAPTMKALWKAAEALTTDNLKAVKAAVRFADGIEDIEKLLSRCQLSEQLEPKPNVSEFVVAAEKMIVEKVRFVGAKTDLQTHESFLRRVGRRSTRLPRLKLFTTNYDLCFEQAASRTRFVVIDGFSHTQPQEFDSGYFSYDLVRRHQDREVPDFIPNVFHMYKLHGSVDWAAKDEQIVRDTTAERPILIYPRETKFQLSYDQPFLEMMARLQMAVRQPNTGLLVVGFGFNDDHISKPLLSAIRSNVSLKVAVVDPFVRASRNPIHVEIVKLIQQGDTRLSLFALPFEGVVPMIPNLVGESEEEQHRDRLSGRRGAPHA